MVDPKVWTDEEKTQLAEAIDMYGLLDMKRLAARVPTKRPYLVVQMVRDMKTRYRKEAECADMLRRQSFVDLNAMDDLFVVGGTRPRDVMLKWMDFLEEHYGKDPFQYDRFKVFTQAFLVISECMPPSTAMVRVTTVSDVESLSFDDYLDLRKVYYFLYRVFNNYCVSRNHKNPIIKDYLYELFMQILEDLEYSSDNEKIAMHNIVSNWTSVNRIKSLKVYGKMTKAQSSIKKEHGLNEYDNSNSKSGVFKVLEKPTIPSINPLRIKSSHVKTEM